MTNKSTEQQANNAKETFTPKLETLLDSWTATGFSENEIKMALLTPLVAEIK